MTLRPGEDDKAFRKKIQNVPKPINDTEVSPEMEQYLDDLNNKRLKSSETIAKEVEDLKNAKTNEARTLFCPVCRKATLKKAPYGYSCGFCGLESSSPLVMAEMRKQGIKQ